MLLFSESASRFVVTIREKDVEAFKQAFSTVPYGVIGKVQSTDSFRVKGLGGTTIIDTTIGYLKKAWQAPFKEEFE
jgi:phosphoribosylformylglycinamidine synthase